MLFDVETFALLTDPAKLRVRGVSKPASAVITRARGTIGGGVRTTGYIHDGLVRGSGLGLDSLVFHIANFHGFRGDPVADSAGRVTPSRLTVVAGDWHLDLDCRPTIDLVTAALKRTSGYGVTHVGRIKRADGGTFRAEESTRVLQAFGELLSFARGSRTMPFLPVGYDPGGHARWRAWERPQVTRWQGRTSWFDASDPGGLSRAFVGAWGRWRDAHQKEVLRRAVYLLVEAQPALEPGLILAQAALELLAWQVLVIEGAAISAKGFESLVAADRLRLLLTQSRIPISVPPSLSDLTSFAASKSLRDGPEALTYLRNRWVHPPRKGVLASGGPEVAQAWQLALWYLDLTLLHWLGFTGTYAPRVRPGTTELVPWT